MRITM